MKSQRVLILMNFTWPDMTEGYYTIISVCIKSLWTLNMYIVFPLQNNYVLLQSCQNKLNMVSCIRVSHLFFESFNMLIYNRTRDCSGWMVNSLLWSIERTVSGMVLCCEFKITILTISNFGFRHQILKAYAIANIWSICQKFTL